MPAATFSELRWPDDWWLLECDECRATWIGPDGEQCQWCEQRNMITLAHQTELDLRPPDLPPGADVARAAAAWIQRLKVATDAGRVDADTAGKAVARWLRSQTSSRAA